MHFCGLRLNALAHEMDLQRHDGPDSDYPDGLPFGSSYTTSLSQPCAALEVGGCLPYSAFYDHPRREGHPEVAQMNPLSMGMNHFSHTQMFYQQRYAAPQQIWASPSTEDISSIGPATADSVTEDMEAYSLAGSQAVPGPPVIEACQSSQAASSPQVWSLAEQQQIKQSPSRASPEHVHETSRLPSSEIDAAILTSPAYDAPPPTQFFGRGSFGTSHPCAPSPAHGLYSHHGYFSQARGAESFVSRLAGSDSTAYSDSSALSCGVARGEVPLAMALSSEDGGSLPRKAGNSGSTAKSDEPYAQLIYKAFLSNPRRAMTLQEIYQWFRENTDKANKPDNKGWQNSIRHNLSMNWAFAKKERTTGEEGDANEGGKKSSEWVLEPWAIIEGVQSTTRYRKGNPSRRRASGPNSSRYGHSTGTAGRSNSLRVLSGRKGGVQASKSKKDAAAKNGGTRKPQHQQHTSVPAMKDNFEPFAASIGEGHNGQACHGTRGHSQATSMGEGVVGLGLGMGLGPAAVQPQALDSAYGYYGSSNGCLVDHVKSEPYMDEPMTPAEITMPHDPLMRSMTRGCGGSEDNMILMQPRLGSVGMETAPYVLSDVVGIYGERTTGVTDGGAGPPLFCEPDEVPGEIARSMPSYYAWNGPAYEY